MRWATRRHCHVDRAACAWLVRRFLDPDAEFVFVDDPGEVPADATPFDMRGVELSHHDGDCSFETFLRRYELADPVLWEMAKVVHEADPICNKQSAFSPHPFQPSRGAGQIAKPRAESLRQAGYCAAHRTLCATNLTPEAA